jgi:nitronate monooxygenase
MAATENPSNPNSNPGSRAADRPYPIVIQGGLGVAVSNWRLARAVSQQGQLGVVSGTALEQVMVRRLQDGDPDGMMREGFDHFPCREMADRLWQEYYLPGGRAPGKPYRLAPLQAKDGPRDFLELCLVSNFVEIYLARLGHSNPVGVNFMEKLQPPHLPSIYGAMLAGADYVLMGAGIPMKIPGVLDRFARHEAATYPLYVAGATAGDDTLMRFDPKEFLPEPLPEVKRPMFLAIVASAVLAATLAKKASGKVDGFIIEGPTAGGHNAPPRGQLQLTESGEPVYGERDRVDLAKFRALGLPFWLAGGYGAADAVTTALAEGAAGVQVGTAFAFCDESGMRDDIKRAVIAKVAAGEICVFTDPLASPTGFPFKIAGVEGTISEEEVFEARPRVCDLGYLREAYREADGHIGFRCPAEPVSVFVAKGGKVEETARRKCICNGLLSAIGLSQTRGNYVEPGVVTAGDDLAGIGRFLPKGGHSYRAADVLSHLLSEVEAPRS